MKAFGLGLMIGVILLPAAVFLYVFLGYAPVATFASWRGRHKRCCGRSLAATESQDTARDNAL
jgi:hypothetical protein